MPVTLLGPLRDKQPGSWSSSRAEGSHPALPLGAISPAGMPLEAVPAPGRNKIKSPQRSPSQYPLLLLWASLLPGPVPGQLRWSRGQGAGSLEGRAHGWSRCSDPLPSAPLNPATDASRVPRSRRLPPPHPAQQVLSQSHTRSGSSTKLCSSSGGPPWLLGGLLGFWRASLASGIRHFPAVRMDTQMRMPCSSSSRWPWWG